MGFLISVVGVRLRTSPCATHNNGRLLFQKTSKGKEIPPQKPLNKIVLKKAGYILQADIFEHSLSFNH